MERTTRFRLLIEAPEILLLPGAHDALSLRLAEQAGFAAVTCGGYSATASLLGAPDVAQLTMTEMADLYARLCDATDLPLFADADTGYGGPANVARTVRAYERAGVGGLFIEDQASPKRCGHMDGKRVVPAIEMVAKLKAALDARVDADLVICARTDARAVQGLDEAIERAQLYREAGADLLFVEAPLSVEELERIAASLPGPLVANMIERGVTPHLTRTRLEQLGFSLIVCPLAALFAAAHAVSEILGELRERETTEGALDSLLAFEELNELVGLESRYADEARYA
jgi:2-methylisocitrate lyase-like PEP mutase family enzyme